MKKIKLSLLSLSILFLLPIFNGTNIKNDSNNQNKNEIFRKEKIKEESSESDATLYDFETKDLKCEGCYIAEEVVHKKQNMNTIV